MEEPPSMITGDSDIIHLPPGFRFHPTDEEIITHYLTQKVLNVNFTATAIGEVDLNKCEPWDLPERARMGEKEWYFFSQKGKKYSTGMRINRATDSGYWNTTGKDKEIRRGKSCLVGMKKTLVFYGGRAPRGEKTNWVMHEYRLHGQFPYPNISNVDKDEWVVCRIFHKSTGLNKPTNPSRRRINSTVDDGLSGVIDPASSSGPRSSFTYAENVVKGTSGHSSSSYFNPLGAAVRPGLLQRNVEHRLSGSIVSGPSPDTWLSADMKPQVTPSAADNLNLGAAIDGLLDDLINRSFACPLHSSDLPECFWEI